MQLSRIIHSMILHGTLSSFLSLSPIINIGHIALIQLANMKIDNIRRLAIPANRRPMGAGNAYTPASPMTRTRRQEKRPTVQLGRARMKRDGNTLSLSLSLEVFMISQFHFFIVSLFHSLHSFIIS